MLRHDRHIRTYDARIIRVSGDHLRFAKVVNRDDVICSLLNIVMRYSKANAIPRSASYLKEEININ
jgi:hypothetical protein